MGWPGLLKSRELSAVPIARYFVVVGSALAALLLIAGWSLPEPPGEFALTPFGNKPNERLVELRLQLVAHADRLRKCLFIGAERK
jgi:hypothetical protein